MSWYVRRGEREIGPLGEDALRALVGTGQITRDTPLLREGLTHWTAAGALPGVLGPRAAAPFTPSPQPIVAVAPEATRPAAGSAAGRAQPELATPWGRYWARCVDLTIGSFLAGVLITAIRPSLLTQWDATPGREWIVALLLLPLALAMDALIYWALGNTPGKTIAGIKVLQEGGERTASGLTYLGRNFGLYVFGLGLGLPLISLCTLIYGYRCAAAGEVSRWDRLSGSRAYALSAGEARTWVAAGMYVIGMAALLALDLGAQHRRSQYVPAPASAPSPNLVQELSQAANRVNAVSPRMIDAITRLDGARAGPGLVFTYDYTLTNIRLRALSPATLQTLRERLSAHVRQAACAGTPLKPMFRVGAVVRFYYRDADGRELALVSVSNADCAG